MIEQDLKMVSVTKRYGTTVAVQSVSYNFKPDSYTCLLGPSGCGKSSTLRMIAGHESVSEGSIVLGGRDISYLPPAQRGTHHANEHQSRAITSTHLHQNNAFEPCFLTPFANIYWHSSRGLRQSICLAQLFCPCKET